MSTQDALFIVLIVCLSMVTYFLIQALRAITRMADALEETTLNIKDKIQMKALAAIPAVLVALATKLFRRR